MIRQMDLKTETYMSKSKLLKHLKQKWESISFSWLFSTESISGVLYIPVNNFSDMLGQIYVGTGLPGLNQYYARINVLFKDTTQ